jgi:diadenosine tetraphosphate (Ap4A) HIT family hydrolase
MATKRSKSCAFCDQVVKHESDRLIYKDNLVMVFPTNIPIVPGHILICPVRCIENINNLTKKELFAIFSIINKLSLILAPIFETSGFNYAWNEGECAGQAVPHLHIHMLPRKPGDAGITTYEPRKFLYRPGSREKSPDRELSSIAKTIRDSMVLD